MAITSSAWHTAGLQLLLDRRDLPDELVRAAVGDLTAGTFDEAEATAFLIALRAKGEAASEIATAVEVLRGCMTRLNPPARPVLDTCGTGGDGLGTFNISTVSAFVVAACGVKVAKHGNRAASSKCGSADLLEALGVKLENPKEKLEAILHDVGIVYLHAPNFHPAMKHAAPVRKELGFRTIFNLLGPICNPAGANVQVIGVFSATLTRPIAQVLRELGTSRAFTFHGHGGLDELSTTGWNSAVDMNAGKLMDVSIGPETVGVPVAKPADLLGGQVADNVKIAKEILAGKKSPKRDIVVLNAAVALVAAGQAKNPKDGADKAAEAIDSGAAQAKLDQFIAATK
jgi:anthranilate phosphoribosyltransferase